MRKGVILVGVSVISLLFLSAILHEGTLEVKAGVPVPQGKIIFVGANFTDDAENHKWNSIQEGINDSEERDVIYVFDGTYRENIFVDKSVEIVGKGDVIIDGMGALYTVNILSDGVKLSNLIISNGNMANLFMDSHSNILVNNCDFSFSNNYGILLTESEYVTFKNCSYLLNNRAGMLLRNSSFISITNSIIGDTAWGIIIENSSNMIVKNAVLNNIENKSISIRESHDAEIINCTISQSFCGIRLRNSDNNVISDCILTENVVGIRLDASQNNSIANCFVTFNRGYGVCISEFDGVPANNNIIYHNFFFNNSNNAYFFGSNSFQLAVINFGQFYPERRRYFKSICNSRNK